MNLYIVVSHYFDSGLFGAYSSVKRARIALENFFADDEDIVGFEDIDGYTYQFTTKRGETFGAEICWDVLDSEFEEGICKEN